MSHGNTDDVDDRTLRTTNITLRIIEQLRVMEEATLSELVDSLEFSKSCIYNHLHTLDANGYVLKEGEQYRLSLKFYSLGEAAKSSIRGLENIERKVFEMANQTGEEVDFSVYEDGHTIVVFDKIGESGRSGFQLGQYNYMNTNAAGKAILAEMPDDRVDEIIQQTGLPKQTEETITTRDELFADLETVRDRGFSINYEENYVGNCAVAVAVNDPFETPIGAIAILGPTWRLNRSDLKNYGKRLSSEIESLETQIESDWVQS